MRKVVTALALLVSLLVFGGVALATPDPEGDGHKVGICHRTASDSNPYVYIEVDEASLSPGHLDNADPGHKPTFWKSDGTFRGVAHSDGDAKDDYLAPNGASDCEDFTTTTTTVPPTTTVTTTTVPPCEGEQCTTTTVPPTTTTTVPTSTTTVPSTTTTTVTTTVPTESSTTSTPPGETSVTKPPKQGPSEGPPNDSPRKLAFTGLSAENVVVIVLTMVLLAALGSGLLYLGSKRARS